MLETRPYEPKYLNPKVNSVASTQFLKEALKERKLKVCPLAKKLKLSKHTLLRLVHGKTQKPDLRILWELADCLDLELMDIVKKTCDLNLQAVEHSQNTLNYTHTIPILCQDLQKSLSTGTSPTTQKSI